MYDDVNLVPEYYNFVRISVRIHIIILSVHPLNLKRDYKGERIKDYYSTTHLKEKGRLILLKLFSIRCQIITLSFKKVYGYVMIVSDEFSDIMNVQIFM